MTAPSDISDEAAEWLARRVRPELFDTDSWQHATARAAARNQARAHLAALWDAGRLTIDPRKKET